MGLSPLANGGRPWKREKKRGINGEGCGNLDILKEDILGSRWKERRKEKGKRKRKRICKRKDIFLILKNENIENTDSRV